MKKPTTRVNTINNVKSSILGLLVTVTLFLLLYVGFQDQFNDINFKRVKEILSPIPAEVYIAYILLALLFFMLRSWRYQLLIAQGKDNQLSKIKLFLATVARGILVDILPARSGEVGFLGVLKYYCAVDFRTGISVVLISILFDLASLIVTVLLVYLVFVNHLSLWVIFVLMLVLMGLLMVRSDLSSLTNKSILLVSRYQGNSLLLLSVVKWLKKFLNIITYTIRRQVLVKVLLLTMAMRISKLMGFIIILKTIMLNSLLVTEDWTNIELLAIITASEVSGAIPIPSAFGFGLWESGGVVLAQFIEKAHSTILIALLSVNFFTKIIGSIVSGLALFIMFFSELGKKLFLRR